MLNKNQKKKRNNVLVGIPKRLDIFQCDTSKESRLPSHTFWLKKLCIINAGIYLFLVLGMFQDIWHEDIIENQKMQLCLHEKGSKSKHSPNKDDKQTCQNPNTLPIGKATSTFSPYLIGKCPTPSSVICTSTLFQSKLES